MMGTLTREVDVLVVGGSAAGVAAAEAAARAGASVFLAAHRSYLGDDLAGALRLWPEAGESRDAALAGAVLGDGERSPLGVKRALEGALIARGVAFRFATAAVAMLVDESGQPCGALLASRSGLLAVVARVVIDATPVADLARGLGERLVERATDVELSFLTIGGKPTARAGERIAAAPAVTLRAHERERELPAWIHRRVASLAGGVGEALDLEARLRADSWRAEALRMADCPAYAAPRALGGARFAASWASVDSVPFEACARRDGRLWVASGACDCSLAEADELAHPGNALYFGERIGAAAASAARGLPAPRPARLAEAGAAAPGCALRWAPEALDRVGGRRIALAGLDRCRLLDEVDVLVVGGGTGGAPAGIAAARDGARTLVCEAAPGLGGVGTQGMIGKYWFGNRVGFTAEIDAGVAAMGVDPNRPAESGAWNVEWKQAWYLRELLAAGGRAWFGAFCVGAAVDDGRVVGALIATPRGLGLVRAKAVVDATGAADVAAAAGAPVRCIGADHVAMQGTGLPPRRPGIHYRNTDWTFVDDADVDDVTQAFVSAREKFRDEWDCGQLIDTRERRQIVGEVELSPLDFLARRTFPDTVVTANSNFDTHGYTVHPVFMAKPMDKQPLDAHVPFRCMLPRGVDGVVVTGLGMCADRDALPVVRMQPDVQNQGFAAGFAAAERARSGIAFGRLDIRALQRRLVAAGVLAPEVASHSDSFPLPEAEIAAAARGALDDHRSLAVLFAHSERARALLLPELGDAARRERVALVLGLMGEAAAASPLAAVVSARAWDAGWNYIGMGQFGMSMSTVDAQVIALGRAGGDGALSPLLAKINALDAGAELSHCRAVAVAAAALGRAEPAAALARLLGLPGMAGHHLWTLVDARARVTPDPNDNETRNRCLRELALARGLWQCGDHDGLARRILEAYARDLRGVYARHARAVLAEPARPERRLRVA